MAAAWSLNCRANGIGGVIFILLFNPNVAIVLSFYRRARKSRRPMNLSGNFLWICSTGLIVRKSIFGQILLKCFATGPDFLVFMFDLFSVNR